MIGKCRNIIEFDFLKVKTPDYLNEIEDIINEFKNFGINEIGIHINFFNGNKGGCYFTIYSPKEINIGETKVYNGDYFIKYNDTISFLNKEDFNKLYEEIKIENEEIIRKRIIEQCVRKF
jgi:hypothetical protein